MLWGTDLRPRELFGDGISTISVTKRSFSFRYRSPEHWVEFFRAYYGPTQKALEALDQAQQADLGRDLLEVLGRFNRVDDGTLVAPSDYLEIVATKR